MVSFYKNHIYGQVKIWKYTFRFFPNFDTKQLFWHRDLNDRDIRLLVGSVELQFDNCLPEKLKFLKSYSIPKMVYHRVISKKPFLILIKED